MPQLSTRQRIFRLHSIFRKPLAASVAMAALAGLLTSPVYAEPESPPTSGSPAAPSSPKADGKARGFRTFLPKPGSQSEEPQGQVIQLLLDRQEKVDHESYLIQVMFRGKPASERVHRVLEDRVEIDFFDTGKPSMRPARIRGGALEATSLEEMHYRDGKAVKRMVRLTLYIHGKPSLRIRNTLDRTLIHFLLPKPDSEGFTPALVDSTRG